MDSKEIVDGVIKKIEAMIYNKDNISVVDVANMSGYSKRHIQKIFKIFTGMNISTYIRKRKLTQAAILLKLTKKKIYHIAMELNFSTQQSFTRAFLREFNVTPLEYRNESGFDCTGLFLGVSINLYIKSPVMKVIDSLKLNTKEFHYRDSLLGKPYSRSNNIRLQEVTSILSAKNEAVIVTTFDPSSYKTEINLVAMIGYSDATNYNYETYSGCYWELEYNGTWEEYIIFGRFFILFIDFKIDLFIIECIQLNGKARDGQQLYCVKVYLPTPHNG
ncbi:helix-turn-helix transcriptional regulator [Citrobacter sp. FP75]|uniref:helix-turn-helix transcriptional regulator n=1 Tax=Citrobacter sp. FP75 TaxID=1852949 RepID=UPI001BC8D878|nr:helix-turn-helix transcriptional regulator [Citrobacter sp. FP75]